MTTKTTTRKIVIDGALALMALVLAGCSKADKAPAQNGGDAQAGAAASAVPSATPAAVPLTGDPCTIVDKATDAVNTVDHSTVITTVMNGGAPRTDESRLVGGKSYVQVHGVWHLSPTSAAENAAMMADERKTAREICKALGDETLDGVATAKFGSHVENEGSTSENMIWIAKDSGLPVKTVSHLEENSVVTQVLSYKNVVAPQI